MGSAPDQFSVNFFFVFEKKHKLNPILCGGGQKRLRISYRLNCSQTDLARDLAMVSKFKFVVHGHTKKKISALRASV